MEHIICKYAFSVHLYMYGVYNNVLHLNSLSANINDIWKRELGTGQTTKPLGDALGLLLLIK